MEDDDLDETLGHFEDKIPIEEYPNREIHGTIAGGAIFNHNQGEKQHTVNRPSYNGTAIDSTNPMQNNV